MVFFQVSSSTHLKDDNAKLNTYILKSQFFKGKSLLYPFKGV